jgi:hexosaminidase
MKEATDPQQGFSSRLVRSQAEPAGAQPIASLLPKPATLMRLRGTFTLDEDTRLSAPEQLGGVTRWLQAALRPATGLPLRANRAGGRIELAPAANAAEGFRLTTGPTGIRIEGGDPAGVFYGCQALLQLLPPAIYRRGKVSGMPWQVPAVRVEDAARHFLPKHDVLRFIALLAMHRLNVLHLHLTDDQGWRLEIRRYPRLTSVGRWRRESQFSMR